MFNAGGLLQRFCHILNLSDHGVTTWRDGPCCPLEKGFEGADLGLLDNPVHPGLSSCECGQHIGTNLCLQSIKHTIEAPVHIQAIKMSTQCIKGT